MTPTTPEITSDARRSRAATLVAAGFILLSAVLSLLWSHARLLWQDEFFSFYTDRVASVRQVIQIQLHYPISLDPPTYHILSHLCMKVIGDNAIALRLPALAGFLLLQWMLFLYVRELASPRSAAVAAALPLMSASFYYSVEGRPYGLLLGLYALSLVCWQRATRETHLSRRWLPLVGIALSITLAITSHYFGVLILIPIGLGELARIWERRSVDYGVLGAILLGAASVALILPFKNALLPYRQHYYIQSVNWHNITQGYRVLFIQYNSWPLPTQRVIGVLLIAGTLALGIAGLRRFRSRSATEPAYLWVGLAVTALLPFCGYFFGKFVTHTMEVRYVVAALIAFVATFAIVMERRFRSDIVYYATLSVILVVGVAVNLANIATAQRAANKIFAGLTLSPACSTAMNAQPDTRIYLQSQADFFYNTYYQPDVAMRSRFSLIYDDVPEVQWLQHNTNFVTAVNMQHFTTLSITPYNEFLAQPHPLALFYGTTWEWLEDDVRARAIPMTNIATCAGGGQLVQLKTATAQH